MAVCRLPSNDRFTRLVARPSRWLLVAGVAACLGGCLTDRSADVTGSIHPAGSPTASLADTESWGARYKADPGNKTAALGYARALRAQTQYQQAVAVLENAAIKAPYDHEILAAYGKALADAGRFREAADVLPRAQTPDSPDWSVLSAQGTVSDQLGDHAKAQAFYTTALKIKPNDPGVTTNLGLSYALSNRLPDAERVIRTAADQPGADMRVRQNLALVLALEGKFGEAEEVAGRDLPPADAKASVASIKAMIAQSDTWRQVQRGKTAALGKPGPGAQTAQAN